MSAAHIVYQLLIGPLELFFEVIYGVSKNLFNHCGLSIFILSMALNVLLLPLYKRADAIQQDEREVEQKMLPWVTHIKKTFQGDERFMMLQTYYRQNNYKPYYALKGSLPLVLEIPFFIAAYRFLSNLQELEGTSFGPIRNLGAPDQLLTIAGVTINVLPILMTLINSVSSTIYTKGLPLKDKLQLYGMALIFLVLLYDSPAGLVFYWTLNNLFSLGKNLLYKVKGPRKIIRIVLCVLGIAVLGYGIGFYHTDNWKHRFLVIAVSLLMETPTVLSLLRDKGHMRGISWPEKVDHRLFLGGCIFLTLLTGALIPSSVIQSSPEEFVLLTDFYSPVRHILNATLLAAGLFVIWLGVFYYLSSQRGKLIMTLLVWIATGISLVNYLFFGTNLGTLSAELIYDTRPRFSAGEKLANLAVVIVIAAVLLLLFWQKRGIAQSACAVLSIVALGMSMINIGSIQGSLSSTRENARTISENEQASFSLSKSGKNVVVLMLDRAVNSYIPYAFQEKPELKDQFDGFVYYPNTLSFGAHTNFGAPALYGGYEYTPEEMNKRTGELLAEKHNEALKVLPVLFDHAGYNVTVCDPPYAGYRWVPDLSIYDEYPGIHTYITEQGQFKSEYGAEADKSMNTLWSRNFFRYSMMKIAPVMIQPNIYQNGTYFEPNQTGINSGFLNSYSVLCALPKITQVDNEERNTFLFLCNSTPHQPALLQEPDYVPAESIDNRKYDQAHLQRTADGYEPIELATFTQTTHYHVNVATLLQLGKWFDYLREEGLYDNTRIILVSDHGYNLNQHKEWMFGPNTMDDVMLYNPLLMVKDFNSHGYTADWSFMTNADVPALAVSELFADPKNPFTGKEICADAKESEAQHVLCSHIHDIGTNNGNTFLPGVWYSAHDNIFDIHNWVRLGEY